MWTEWSTAQIALVVSALSFALAFANFVWNIWSKFIYPKPKLEIWVDLMMFHPPSKHSCSLRSDGSVAGDFPRQEMTLPAISATVTNHGPGNAVITHGVARLPFFHPRRKEGHALLIAYADYPTDLSAGRTGSGGLPKKLEAGETWMLTYPADALLLNKREIASFGVRDSLSRVTWATWKNMRNLQRQCLGLELETNK